MDKKNQNLLTLEDLYKFYSTKKKSMSFNFEKSGYNIAVQTPATFTVKEDPNSEGLLYGKIRAFHDLTNNNRSHIKTDVFKEKVMSMKDRPIMADIIETDQKDSNGNALKDFNGHTMELNEETGEVIYIEKPVGHFVNPENITVEYDEEFDRNFASAECVLYEGYSEACDIMRRRETVDCSVELVIRDMSYNAADKVLILNDFYVMGCTLLGSHVLPGMSGSKVSLKDFSEENNSMFSNVDEISAQLVKMQESINSMLERLNINQDSVESEETYRKEETEKMENENVVVEEELEVIETESTEEVTEVESTEEVTENESQDTVEETPEVVETNEEETVEVEENEEAETVETVEVEETEEVIEESVEEVAEADRVFTRSFELSHDDVRCALYQLLVPYEEADNGWYWISEVYDSYFVYEGWNNKIYRQNYTKDGDVVSFVDERVELFRELLTASEKAELESMRANYSSIQAELQNYKYAEVYADKMTVFDSSDYAQFLNTEEFKSLMTKESVDKYSKEELHDKAELCFAKLIRNTANFSASVEKKEEVKKESMFAFARNDGHLSYLDSLLQK